MMPIEVKNLDKDKMDRWLKSAIDKQKDDPVFSFIASWIAFNYYYTSFSTEYRWLQFDKWCKENNRDHDATTTQLHFLLQSKEFKNFFSTFRTNNIFEESIDLPVWNMVSNGFIPPVVRTNKKNWKDLGDDEIIIEVLYRIRNNIFHGQKDPEKHKRDLVVSTAACNFMIPFLSELIKATQT